MSYPVEHAVAITTDSSGDGTGYTPKLRGKITSIQYVPDGSSPFAATVDFTITTENTARTIWTESNVTAAKEVHPHTTSENTDGTTVTTVEGSPNFAPLVVAGERVKIVVAQGGDTKSGTFYVTVDGAGA